MTPAEQKAFKEAQYQEALRHMDNAKESLKKAEKDGPYYGDSKYVKTASRTAYSGVLVALDAYLQLKQGLKYKRPENIEQYKYEVGKYDKQLLKTLNAVYSTLHLGGYYDGNINVKVVQAGFDDANRLIGYIKP